MTRSQGIFSYRQIIRCWGLDYIAENIQAPAAVLHYPSEFQIYFKTYAKKTRGQFNTGREPVQALK